MAELSKFYQVTNQIMLEYVANQYDANDTPDEKTTDYTVYIGKDGNVYYTEKPQDIDNDRYERIHKQRSRNNVTYGFFSDYIGFYREHRTQNDKSNRRDEHGFVEQFEQILHSKTPFTYPTCI